MTSPPTVARAAKRPEEETARPSPELLPAPSHGPRGQAWTETQAEALEWRVLRDPPWPGGRNMAIDHALALAVRSGEGVLRLYRWDRPTVSFGRNERTKGLYSRRAGRELGVGYVRRPTGGRAVLHADELTYSVVTPVRALGGARLAYRRLNEALARALRALGAEVVLAEDVPSPGPDAGPCFQSPAGGEIVARGRKLVGSAQARIGGALLQHGSIILSGDQSMLGALAPVAVDREPPATLTKLIGAVGVEEVADAMAEGMAQILGGRWSEGVCRSDELAEAHRLEEERYADEDWTWRR